MQGRARAQAGAPSAPTNFAAGVAAAVAATLLTQPADMLRTHMQARPRLPLHPRTPLVTVP